MRKMAWKPWRHIFWCDGGVNVGRRLITGAAAATTPDAAASLLRVCVVGSGPAGFYTAEKVDLILVFPGNAQLQMLLAKPLQCKYSLLFLLR